MFENDQFLPQDQAGNDDELNISFDALDKGWSDLDENQKASALGRLWEVNKEVVASGGEKTVYNWEKFITEASKIIGESKQRIEELLDKHLHQLPGAQVSSPETDTKAIEKDSQTDGISEEKKPEPKDVIAEKPGRTRKSPELIDTVVLTPEKIREINKGFALRAEMKRFAQSKKG